MPLKDRAQKLEYDRGYTATLHLQRKKQGLCVHCGNPAVIGKAQCQSCRERDRVRLKTSRLLLKKRAIEHLGSKCADCGLKTDFISVYDFHHEDADRKEAKVSTLITRLRAWEEVQVELDKCILLCANCHRIRHELEDNGSPLSGILRTPP